MNHKHRMVRGNPNVVHAPTKVIRCECERVAPCDLYFEVRLDLLRERTQHPHWVFISNDCKNGVTLAYTQIAHYGKYSIYEERKLITPVDWGSELREPRGEI